MVPDVVPPPPPPPMPSANYVPPKSTLTIVKSDRAPSPPKNPLATNDSFDNVINEIKTKGGTLRKTERKEDCIVPSINFIVTATAKPTFKNEIVINVKNSITLHSENSTCGTTENCTKLSEDHLNGIAYKLRRPSDFHNGLKPELPATKKEVVRKPQLPPKTFLNGTNQDNKSAANGIKMSCEYQKPSNIQHPERKLGLVGSTIQRLTSTEPDSPTESPFKRNQVLTRSTSDGIGSTIQKLERQTSTTDTSSTTKPSFQRSNSVRQRINQMNQVDNPKATVKDGTRTIGRKPMVPRPTNRPRPSIGTTKLLNDLQNRKAPLHNNPSGNVVVRLENEEARVGTTVNVADVTGGTVTASDPNVKKLVYNTYRNFLGAYNTKANNVVTNQNGGRMAAAAVVVVQDKGVAEQLKMIAQNGKITNLTGRAIQKTDD